MVDLQDAQCKKEKRQGTNKIYEKKSKKKKNTKERKKERKKEQNKENITSTNPFLTNYQRPTQITKTSLIPITEHPSNSRTNFSPVSLTVSQHIGIHNPVL